LTNSPVDRFFCQHWKIIEVSALIILVRDSSTVRRLFVRLAGAVGRALHKENSRFAAPTLGWYISTFRGYQKSRRTVEESRTSIINAHTSIIFQCWQKKRSTGLLVNTGFNRSILVDWSKSQIGLCKLIPKRVFLVGVSIFNLQWF
jgi:hypothetical protein